MTNTVPSFACLYTVIPCMTTNVKSYQFADKSSSDQTFSEINRPCRDSKIHFSFPNSPSKKKRITYILASTGYLYNNSERISAAKMNRTSQHTRFNIPCEQNLTHEKETYLLDQAITKKIISTYQRNKSSHCTFVAAYTLTWIKRIASTTVHV